MKNVIHKLLDNPGTNLVMGSTPDKLNDSLRYYDWNVTSEYPGENCTDWSYVEYVSEYFPDFKITMKWKGWTGKVELVATRIEEEDTLIKGFRRVLVDTNYVMMYQNYDFTEIGKFVESKGWEFYKAITTVRWGWCHYIYHNIDYPNRELILAWDPVSNIAELRTMLNNEVEDE